MPPAMPTSTKKLATPPLRDNRDNMPKTAQNDPNKFPPVAYQRYPLAPVDDATGKHFLDELNQPVILMSREEEEAFAKEHKTMRPVYDPEEQMDELARLRAENAALKANQGVAGATPSVSDVREPIDEIASAGAPEGGHVAGLVKPGEQRAPEPVRPATQHKGPKPGDKLK